ncbi:hypothetical protein IAT38_000053 [Cryptococcus sp. DSM 104549]
MPLMPTPPEGERVPLDAFSEAVALEEGVIDLRPGTDYSRCPDVFEYLQLIGKALDCRGGPFAKAEKGRRFLQKRMAENKGQSFRRQGRILLTNIRAPIPPFVDNDAAPKPHSQDYARLISVLYSPKHHPLGYALQRSQYGEAAIMGLLSSDLIKLGFQVVGAPYHKPCYDAPWVNWSHDVEMEYAKRRDPERYRAWMKEREAEEANPRKLVEGDWCELVMRKVKSWCRHDEPEEYCHACYCEESERKQRTQPGPSERSL